MYYLHCICRLNVLSVLLPANLPEEKFTCKWVIKYCHCMMTVMIIIMMTNMIMKIMIIVSMIIISFFVY